MVLRLVFKTVAECVGPGDDVNLMQLVSVASTHRFETGGSHASGRVGVFPKFPADGRQGSKQSFGPVLVCRSTARQASRALWWLVRESRVTGQGEAIRRKPDLIVGWF